MSTWRWVAPAVLYAIHDRQLAEHGGQEGNLGSRGFPKEGLCDSWRPLPQASLKKASWHNGLESGWRRWRKNNPSPKKHFPNTSEECYVSSRCKSFVARPAKPIKFIVKREAHLLCPVA